MIQKKGGYVAMYEKTTKCISIIGVYLYVTKKHIDDLSQKELDVFEMQKPKRSREERRKIQEQRKFIISCMN